MGITVDSQPPTVKRVISGLTVPQGYTRLIPSFLTKSVKTEHLRMVSSNSETGVDGGRALCATCLLPTVFFWEISREQQELSNSETGEGREKPLRDGKSFVTNVPCCNLL